MYCMPFLRESNSPQEGISLSVGKLAVLVAVPLEDDEAPGALLTLRLRLEPLEMGPFLLADD